MSSTMRAISHLICSREAVDQLLTSLGSASPVKHKAIRVESEVMAEVEVQNSGWSWGKLCKAQDGWLIFPLPFGWLKLG